ncbi:MAG: phosphatidate cytidylyltransferase [Hypericibacter sp.]
MTAPAAPGATSASHSLARRIVAAFVMMPVVLGALWLGHPYWTLLVALAAGMMAWEWRRLTAQGTVGAVGWAMVLLAAAAVLLLGFGQVPLALWALLGGALLLGLVASLGEGWVAGAWVSLGILYAGLPSLALVWLRYDPVSGLATLLWVLFLVWAVDTAAYTAGKLIGGPKLIPRVSPSKTWAGLAGGAAGAAIIGYLAACWAGQPNPWLLTGLSLLLALAEQAGDIFESAVKRRFGVKDSSGLIPGHGGILDRVDGLVAVALIVAGFALWGGGSPLAVWGS